MFLRVTVMRDLFRIFSISFCATLCTGKRLGRGTLVSPVLGLLTFPIICLLFRGNFSPMTLS